MKRVKNINWGIAGVGMWVALAPAILGNLGTPAVVFNDLIVGLAVLFLAATAAVSDNAQQLKAMNWVTAALGMWLVLAPFILGYSVLGAALWSDIISGIVILGLSVWAESVLPTAIEDPA